MQAGLETFLIYDKLSKLIQTLKLLRRGLEAFFPN